MDNKLKAIARSTLLCKWAERVKSCRSSGLTVRAWCGQNGIKESTYYSWQKRVFEELSSQVRETPGSPAPVFAEIPRELPPRTNPGSVAATVRLGEMRVDFYENASREFVENFLRGMRSC